jgi:hypothetical protein
MPQGTGEIGLSGAGGSNEEYALSLADPVTAGEAQEQGSIEAPTRAEVEVFDGSVEVEPGLAEETLEASIGAVGLLPVEEEGQAVLERQIFEVRYPLLFLEGGSHAG